MLIAVDKKLQNTTIAFKACLNYLLIEIETSNLYMRSYEDSDFANCASLYGNEKLTRYFDHGKPLGVKEVEALVNQRGKYFSRNKQPFGIFSAFRKDTMEFIGQFDLLPMDRPGVAEIGCILHREHQNQGFSLEGLNAILHDYIPKVNSTTLFYQCEAIPISTVIATFHPKNLASRRLAEYFGFKFMKILPRFGNQRIWYQISV